MISKSSNLKINSDQNKVLATESKSNRSMLFTGIGEKKFHPKPIFIAGSIRLLRHSL